MDQECKAQLHRILGRLEQHKTPSQTRKPVVKAEQEGCLRHTSVSYRKRRMTPPTGCSLTSKDVKDVLSPCPLTK